MLSHISVYDIIVETFGILGCRRGRSALRLSRSCCLLSVDGVASSAVVHSYSLWFSCALATLVGGELVGGLRGCVFPRGMMDDDAYKASYGCSERCFPFCRLAYE